ncbi:G/U mismatch-specific DNA glycosylase [candidate division FCPU426 bacterium]|nr:G/U mismatch-specific DNA glycosylase [candidate division FCPU426 bacterium]
METHKPTNAELQAARKKTVPDVVVPGLKVLFCGINPGLYSGAIGHHFAKPGNRFWPALHASGFTNRRLSPFAERDLLPLGYGITNLVKRTTASAAELTPAEFFQGARQLAAKVRKYRPGFLAVLGLQAYGLAFGKKQVKTGLQAGRIGRTRIWVLPNPSGLNAHYQAADLARLFKDLKKQSG